MAALPRPTLDALPDSPYAAELRRGVACRSFATELEHEYLRARLEASRTLIRAAALLAVMLAASREIDNLVAAPNRGPLLLVGVVLAGSVLLASLACTRLFDRFYLPFARIIVPARNALAAAPIAAAAVHGQIELLMILPCMVLGPFFFMGLSLGAALVSVLATIASFIVSAAVLGLAAPIAMHSFAFLVMTVAACVIAARHLDVVSRRSFLENRLIGELAEHDALTGTKNRRMFDEQLGRLWQQAAVADVGLAILLIDIDHFKAYNDRHGHQAGDEVLRRTAGVLQSFVSRPLDVLARYGGEEFAVILYDIDGPRAEDLAERMCRAAGRWLDAAGRSGTSPVTISVGVAVVEPTAQRNPQGALQLADQALYKAKVRGRNRVELMNDAEYAQLVTGVFSKTALAQGS